LKKICILGLGYVGLPLAVAFGRQYATFGFDINSKRVDELNKGFDITDELTQTDLAQATVSFTSNLHECRDCNIFIVTVPTPINENKEPDLQPLEVVSALLQGIIKAGDIIIYESTVYPGVTEEVCVPILEKSGLRLNHDFYVGYSPERINPGDKVNKLETIKKVVSGSNQFALERVAELYESIITAGVHRASSIKVAEASKVTENIQRDVNIALVNELAMIFDSLGIDTGSVMEAADTKWNFVRYHPGLVGGHCISVDPYYLVRKAAAVGVPSRIISEARIINESMAGFVRDKLFRLIITKNITSSSPSVLLLGYTFKANCPDTRNTKVQQLWELLDAAGLRVSVHDPFADTINVRGVKSDFDGRKYDAIILAVAHNEYTTLLKDGSIHHMLKDKHVLFDLTGTLPRETVDARL